MNIITKILSDSDRKSRFKIFKEITTLIVEQKNISNALDFYASNLMYKKDAGNIKNYVPNKTLWKLRSAHNKKELINNLLLNKIDQVRYLNSNDISTAEFLGELNGKRFFDAFQNETFIIDKNSLKSVLRNLLKFNESVFFKPIGTGGGDGILKIDLNNLNEELTKINLDRNYIIEKTLIQHAALSEINSSCINTLRVFTYRKGDEILIPGSFLRMGIGKSHIDNASKGSIFTEYNLNSNKLGSIAYNHFRFGGKSFTEHPDTGFIFKDKPLVYPEKVKELVTQGALLFDAPLLGWDIAYTSEKPKVIEINDDAGVIGMQISMRGVLSNSVFNKVYNPNI